jgi:acetolactate synthase-1/2/3 large subunit
MARSTVGRVIVDAIRKEGIRHVFCVPGESYLGLLDAFHEYEEPRLVTTHHEEGAGMMAEACAKASGRPGVVMVTRGPGLTHLAIAIHTAMQDSTPLVALVGQVPRGVSDRGAFQEVDVPALGRALGKWGVEIRDPERSAELVHRAFHVAQAGRPGPVLVSIPEDVGLAEVHFGNYTRSQVPVPAPRIEDIERAASLLTDARSVAVLVGGGSLRSGATDALTGLATELAVPVYTAWRRFDAFPNAHPLYAGNVPWIPPHLQAPLREAGVILAAGTRLGDFTSFSYSLPSPDQRLIHIDVSAEAMSVASSADVPIQADCRLAVEMLTGAVEGFAKTSMHRQRWRLATAAHQAYLDSTRASHQESKPGYVELAHAFEDLRRLLPTNTATTSDAGAFAAFLNRHFQWPEPGTFFGATSGAMGYAVPAAIGVKLTDPKRPVVAFSGDGGFAMVMSEVHTAVRLALEGIVFVVFDNHCYGAIKRNQRKLFPGREIATDLGEIDFCAVAEAMGAAAFKATSNSQLVSCVSAALAAQRPAVVQALTDPEELDAWATYSETVQ